MKRLKLRNWVKVTLVIIAIIGLIQFGKYVDDSYKRCMEHTNGNVNVCSSLKN